MASGRTLQEMKSDPVLQKALRARLDGLLRLAPNQKCADCRGSGGAGRTKYASVKLGVFLCNGCYAIHRTVGAHVTRVKVVSASSLSALGLARQWTRLAQQIKPQNEY
eukprot:SAG11_NODE_9975_length_865_cov_1.244125_2_plen_108_part_00